MELQIGVRRVDTTGANLNSCRGAAKQQAGREGWDRKLGLSSGLCLQNYWHKQRLGMGKNMREKYLQWKVVDGSQKSIASRPERESQDTWHPVFLQQVPGRPVCLSALPSACSVCSLSLLFLLTWLKPLLRTMKCQPCISVSLPFHTMGFFFKAFFFFLLLYFFLTTYEIIDKRVQNHEHCNKPKH